MTPLEVLVRERIGQDGPITVADFMALASTHARHGYYMSGDPFGVDGDYTTAPEVSQVFGELIGLWAGVTWRQMGCPDPVLIVECGPGRGTLMRDFLRASSRVEGFHSAMRLHLVEISHALRAVQRSALSGMEPRWHGSVRTLPPGPTILIANEFLDALPVRQFVRVGKVWEERRIAVVGNELTFVTSEAPDACRLIPPNVRSSPQGAVFEYSAERVEMARHVGSRICSQGGAALLIDYGHDRSAPGETLQAVSRHATVPPLSAVGETDVSAHVDFGILAQELRNSGAAVHGPANQRKFLRSLGIETRTDRLACSAGPKAESVRNATRRLIDPGQMGTLFKALAASSPDLPPPAGFEAC